MALKSPNSACRTRVSMPDLLCEAVPSCRQPSCRFYGGAAPCNARFGRHPRMLADMFAFSDDAAGVARNSRWLGGIAVQRI
eukprot:4546328-Pyramimonas_sp.AAC.1